jgi:aromatic-amino-acid transaminase
MLAALARLPQHSVVLLHACCHNPTGVDLDQAQWLRLIALLGERQLIPFVDIAYQGLGAGIEQDALCLRAMAEAGLQFFVASSFSKNFSLYGERCGALSVVCQDSRQAQLVSGQLQLAVRRNYSNPPTHGASLVAGVLADPVLRDSWEHELEQMRQRIEAMRWRLRAALAQRLPGHDFSRVTSQRGMFTFTGLTPEQVTTLRDDHAVYLLGNGRMCMAGLNHNTVDTVARAIALATA